MATATKPTHSSVLTNRFAVVGVAAAGVLVCNLVIYVIGRTCGAGFTYTQNGKTVTVDAGAVALLSVVPLAIGSLVVGWLSRWWPVLIRLAKVTAAALAIGTIGFMTIPAGFDTTSTLFLAAMHVTLVPAAVIALGALDPRG